MTKRTPRQILRTLERNAFESEAARLASLSPEQMVQEARDAGIDVEQQAREADVWLAKLERGEIVPSTDARRARQRREESKATQPVPPPREVGNMTGAGGRRDHTGYRRWASVFTLAAAASIAPVLGGPALMVALRDRAQRPDVSVRPVYASYGDRLRVAAVQACDTHEWRDCIILAHRAVREDPREGKVLAPLRELAVHSLRASTRGGVLDPDLERDVPPQSSFAAAPPSLNAPDQSPDGGAQPGLHREP